MADDISPQALSDLIGSIYDCTLEPERWDKTLIDLRDAFAGYAGTLCLLDSLNDRVLVNRTTAIKQSSELASEVNRIVGNFASLLTRRKPFVLSRDVSPSYPETSSYLRDCGRSGIVDILQYILMRTPTRLSLFAVSRHEGEGKFTEREVLLGDLLLPHLRRAVTISNVLEARTIKRTLMAEALDSLRCGVVLVDERSNILHANCAAEDMLRKGIVIHTSRGMLMAKVPAAAKELRSAINLAAKNETQLGRTGFAIRLTRDSVVAVFASVLPMAGSDLRTRLQPTAAAAVFIGASEDCDANAMARTYGLTQAETRVLASLLAGRTLAETATALNVAATTAKTHLENIFSKTGVSRQAQLMLLASRADLPFRLSVHRP